ncbi:recombinase family protein [Psychromonas sp.]|uniref:recombinase family protein n=1 Tax=Psychromonas sp. TaxID=1884585 RepID=UPI003A97FCE3
MSAQVYSYQRFSRHIQKNGSSLKRQREYARAVAQEHGLSINKKLIMTDEGRSAFHADHIKSGALGEFIQAVEKGIVAKGSILIVESLDRLSRQSAFKANRQFSELIDRGITIITACDQQVYNLETLNKDPSKLILSIGVMMRAHEESVSKQQRSIKSIQNKLNNFNETGKGDLAGSVPFWISRKNGGFELNQHASIVNQIIQLYLDNVGLNLIARELTESGIKPPNILKGVKPKKPRKNESWGVTTIRKILDSRALYGCYAFKMSYLVDGVKRSESHELENYYPNILSKEQFNLIQERKRKKQNSRESYKNSVYLLTSYGKGRSICALCGQALVSQLQKQMNRKGEYTQSVLRIHCTKHKETANCCNSVKAGELEQHFIHAVIANVDKHLFEPPEDGSKSIESVEATIKTLSSTIDELMSLFTDSNVAAVRKSAMQKITSLGEEIENNEKELKRLKKEFSYEYVSHEQERRIKTLAIHAQDFYNSKERSQLKQILMQSIKRIRIDLRSLELEAIFFNGRILSIKRREEGFVSHVYVDDKNGNNIYRKLNNIER